MKMVRSAEFTHATLHGRTPAVRLVLDERDKLLVEAAKFFPGASDREAARQLHTALSRYHAGRWRRDCIEATCPTQHRGKLVALLWMIFKTADRLVSEVTIRRAIATRDPAMVLQSDI